MKKILLLVDHKKRDLAGLLLLANNLLLNGFHVYLSSTRQFSHLAIHLNIDIILINHARNTYDDEVRLLSLNGVQVYVLDTEGAVFDDKFEYYLNSFSKNSMNFISGIFTWGESQKKLLENKFISLRDRIHCTGHPKFEYLVKYSNFQNRKNNILINLSFPLFNPKYTKWSNDILDIVKISKADISTILKKVEYQATLYFRVIGLILELSELFPSINFIIRPHPFENTDDIENIFRNMNNVIIEKDSALAQCVDKYDYLLHLGCTTGIEFSIANKIPILLDFLIDDKFKIPLLTSLIGYKVSDKDNLFDFLKTFNKSLLIKLDDNANYDFRNSLNINLFTSSLITNTLSSNLSIRKNFSFGLKIAIFKTLFNSLLLYIKYNFFNFKLIFYSNDKIINKNDFSFYLKKINFDLKIKVRYSFCLNLFLYRYFELKK